VPNHTLNLREEPIKFEGKNAWLPLDCLHNNSASGGEYWFHWTENCQADAKFASYFAQFAKNGIFFGIR
jgi:hypothetical protein